MEQMDRITKTGYIVALYGIVWVLLELILYGQPKGSPEDNIMMLLFMPVIYKAVEKQEKK